MFIKANRIEPTPNVGDVFELEGAQWRVLYRNGSWLEVVDASEPVEPEPPKPKYFAPSDLRDSFEKVNRKLERLGAQMEREYPFGGTCCRDCEWSGHPTGRRNVRRPRPCAGLAPPVLTGGELGESGADGATGARLPREEVRDLPIGRLRLRLRRPPIA